MMRIFFGVLFFCYYFSAFASEVSHYAIEAAFDPDKHTIEGTLTLDYYNGQDESTDTISLMLLANLSKKPNEAFSSIVQDASYRYGFEAGYTKIHRVASKENNELRFSIRKGFEFLQDYSNDEVIADVFLEKRVAPGERSKIRIEFSTKLPNQRSDLGYFHDVYTARFSWFPQEVPTVSGRTYEGYLFNPFKYSLKLTMPKDYVLAQIGDTFNNEIVGEKKQYSIESHKPVRTIPLSISNNFKIYRKKIGDLLISVYAPGPSSWILHGNHDDDAAFVFDRVTKILDYYQNRFGSLPYGSLSFSVHYADNVFFASDGLIYLAESFFFKDMTSPGLKDRLFEYVIAHEIAHLYWGIGVSNDFYFDDWIAEGLAEYSGISYLEYMYGAEDNFFKLNSVFYVFLYLLQAYDPLSYYFPNSIEESYFITYRRNILDGLDAPIQKQPFFYNDRTNFDLVRTYLKSYLILKSLSSYIGKDEFNKVLRTVYEAKDRNFITTRDFETIVEDSSDKDISRFFSDWFYNNHSLDYEVVEVKNKSQGTMIRSEITIKRHGQAYLPTFVKVYFEDTKTQVFYVEEQKDTFTLTIDSTTKIERVELDPDHELPDFNRANNYYPRKSVKLSLLFEYPLDRYNINFAPYIFGGYGIRINGHFLDDHYWSLLAIYTSDFVYFYERLAYRIARAQFIDVTLNQIVSTDSIREFFLINELGYSFTLFEKKKLGLTRYTDINANQFRFALGFDHFKELSENTKLGDNTKDELPDIIEYVRFNYTRHDLITLGLLNEAEVLYSPEILSTLNNQFGRLTLRTSHLGKITRYLNSYAFLELGLNTNHDIKFYHFNLDELYIFNDIEPSLRRFLGSIELSHPLLRTRKIRYFGVFEDTIPFLNSVVFEGLSLGALVRAGYLWDTNFGANEIHGSYGPFIEILNNTLFDAPISLRVGSVFPFNKLATTSSYQIFVEAYAAF